MNKADMLYLKHKPDLESLERAKTNGVDKVLVINTDGGQIAVRADLIAFFLRGNESGAVDVMLTNGDSAQLGIVDIDTFKQVAQAWNQALLNMGSGK